MLPSNSVGLNQDVSQTSILPKSAKHVKLGINLSSKEIGLNISDCVIKQVN